MGKQEKYRKPEDNRDIFDKISDALIPPSIMIGGGLIGRRLGGSAKLMNEHYRKGMESLRKGTNLLERNRRVSDPPITKETKQRAEDYHKDYNKHFDEMTRIGRNRNIGMTAGGISGGAGGVVYDKTREIERKRRK